jgi:ubiquinone/menaquinone biosynthesis C-methylase UbiE
MTVENKDIKHAMRYSKLNQYYDRMVQITCRENYFKTQMINLSKINTNDKVLDIASGTGTFITMIKSRISSLEIIGVDADESIIRIAERKTKKFSNLRFIQARAEEIPLPGNSMDKIYCSFLYHHLDRKSKIEATREALRILKPGDKYMLADWGRPSGFLTYIGFLLVRLLDGFDTTADNYHGILPQISLKAGRSNYQEVDRINTLLGTVKIWILTK